MNELKVNILQTPGKINFNFLEIKENLEQMMGAYENAIFHEDTVKYAKLELASLRKIKAALDERRLEIKREYLKPLDEFENKVKELQALIDKPVTLIDKQIKDFAEKERLDKRQKITSVFNSLVGDMREYVRLDNIYNPKWENKSYSINSIADEIASKINQTKADIDIISGFSSEAVPAALEVYKMSYQLQDAIRYINNYEKQKAEILSKEEQRRKAEQEEKLKEELRKEIKEEIKAEDPRIISHDWEPIDVIISPPDESPFLTPSDITATYELVATAEELHDMELYLNAIGIFFKRLN